MAMLNNQRVSAMGLWQLVWFQKTMNIHQFANQKGSTGQCHLSSNLSQQKWHPSSRVQPLEDASALQRNIWWRAVNLVSSCNSGFLNWKAILKQGTIFTRFSPPFPATTMNRPPRPQIPRHTGALLSRNHRPGVHGTERFSDSILAPRMASRHWYLYIIYIIYNYIYNYIYIYTYNRLTIFEHCHV